MLACSLTTSSLLAPLLELGSAGLFGSLNTTCSVGVESALPLQQSKAQLAAREWSNHWTALHPNGTGSTCLQSFRFSKTFVSPMLCDDTTGSLGSEMQEP